MYIRIRHNIQNDLLKMLNLKLKLILLLILKCMVIPILRFFLFDID